jgi:plasmid stabilization system protein ParE
VKPARFDGAAQAEVDLALAWYAERDPDLPARLLSEIRDTVERLRQFPQASPRIVGLVSTAPTRRALLRKLPYALIYVELEKELRIVAFAHAKRRPLYWISRISE